MINYSEVMLFLILYLTCFNFNLISGEFNVKFFNNMVLNIALLN